MKSVDWNLERKVRTGYAIALGVLLLVDAVALISVRRLTSMVQQQVHSYKVLDDLDELLSLLLDAETGQRGFLLTGDEHYLEPYRASVRHRAEVRLEEALCQIGKKRDELLAILNQLDVAAAITDPQGRLTFLSRVAQRKFARCEEDVLGFGGTLQFDSQQPVIRP